MSANHQEVHAEAPSHGSVTSYVIGFVLSIVLTLVAYFLVVQHGLARPVLISAISAAAVVQLWIQMKFFLHLTRDSWLSFVFSGIMVLIVVFGTLWVMHDLNYFMMDPVMEEAAQMKMHHP